MEHVTIKNLLEILLEKYQAIIGKDNIENVSSENLLDYIINYYVDIIRCMPGNVYWLDTNCITVGCNTNVLTMLNLKSSADFKGLSFEEMGKIGHWDPDIIKSFKDDTLAVIRSGKPKLNAEEPPIPHSDGRLIHFLTSRVPLFDQRGKVIGVVGISVDISELKQTQIALKKAKEQAETASNAKSEFIANMSHDIKTPLAGIIGISELLTHRLHDEDGELAETLLMSGRQLYNFIDNCLEISKMDNSSFIPESEYFNLKSLINEIYDLFQPAVKAKNLTISIYIDEELPPHLIGNRAGTYRVLLNLVGNAVKFTSKGSITINFSLAKKTSNREAIIKLVVEDTGIGIAQEKQKIIFDRFTRLIPSYKGTHEGSGIGLYIVQTFVKKMHGEIYLQSAIGKGSQFSVILPFQIPLLEADEYKELSKTSLYLYRDSNSAKPSHKTHSNVTFEATTVSTVTPLRVLLVEDNIIAQRMESSLLASLNCLVEIADSGKKALDTFNPGKYDLILMDIGLPDMQGDTVAKQIRKAELGTPYQVPIIALTAHTTADMNNNCIGAGMNDVYSKPLLRDQAQQIINRYYN